MQSVRDRLEAILSRLAGRASDETVYTRLYPEAARAAADAADAKAKTATALVTRRIMVSPMSPAGTPAARNTPQPMVIVLYCGAYSMTRRSINR